MIADSNDAERATIDREEIARKNGDALMALIAKHSLFIPARDLARWRPTAPTTGYIDGFYDLGNLTCIATDGLQAYFLVEGRPPHIGHIQWFRWDIAVVSMVPYLKDGEVRYFKSVKDSGAPSALYRKDPPHREPREVKKRKSVKKKSKRQELLDSI